MRIEHDAAGVSVFLGSNRSWFALAFAGPAIPGWVFLSMGLLFSSVGLAWIGPGFVFVGLALLISVPLTMDDLPADHCDYVRLDHLGVRLDGRLVSASARLEPLQSGIRVHDGTRSVYLPVQPDNHETLLQLLRDGLGHAGSREDLAVPADLRALLSRVHES